MRCFTVTYKYTLQNSCKDINTPSGHKYKSLWPSSFYKKCVYISTSTLSQGIFVLTTIHILPFLLECLRCFLVSYSLCLACVLNLSICFIHVSKAKTSYFYIYYCWKYYNIVDLLLRQIFHAPMPCLKYLYKTSHTKSHSI